MLGWRSEARVRNSRARARLSGAWLSEAMVSLSTSRAGPGGCPFAAGVTSAVYGSGERGVAMRWSISLIPVCGARVSST